MKMAVVGCGQIADAHVMEALKIPRVSIVGVCDQNWHMADQLAVRFSLRPSVSLHRPHSRPAPQGDDRRSSLQPYVLVGLVRVTP